MSDQNRQWGSHAWRFLHHVAHGFPERPCEAEMDAAASLVKSLSRTLPCARCRDHWSSYVASEFSRADVASRDAFAKFMNRAHNVVNARLNKRQVSWSEACGLFGPENAGYRAVKRAIKHVLIVIACVAAVITATVFFERNCARMCPA